MTDHPHTHKEEPRSWEELAKREYLRGIIDGQEERLAVGYSMANLDKIYAEYLEKNPEALIPFRSLLSTREKEGQEEILMLITKEINIAHLEGQPTSRLTSLYNKVATKIEIR